MTLYGDFKDFNDVLWHVEITNTTPGEPLNVHLGETPVMLSTTSRGLFTPIKSRSMTIEVATYDWFKDFYEPASRGTTVKLWKGTVENQDVYFRGYLTPCEYDQDFTYLDVVELEAVDALSTCKDFKWQNTNKYENFLDIIISILKSAGYRGNLYVPRSYEYINDSAVQTDVLSVLYASSNNFIDDNEEHTPWTQYEVIEEIMKFLGWSMVPDGDDVWCVDYRYENSGETSYSEYNIADIYEQDGVTIQYHSGTLIGSIDVSDNPKEIEVEDMAEGESKLSIDDIYNKIELSDNFYKIDEIAPDMFDDNYHISINEEQNFPVNEHIYSKINRTGWWFWKKENEVETGYDYQTICRLDEEKTGWKHIYYRRKPNQNTGVLDKVNSYYDEQSDTQFEGMSNSLMHSKLIYYINKYCNTTCALVQHHAYREASGNQLPSSIDWDNILTFFIIDDTCMNSITKISDLAKWEVPVLEYTTGEEIMFKPSSGTTWITIKGDLFYQNNQAAQEDNKEPYCVINWKEGYYATAPIDKGIQVKAGSKIFESRKIDKLGNKPANYGEGWKCWKMKLQIGDKFWNGSQWVEYNDPNDTDNVNAPTFYINYNNGPTYNPKDEEYLPAFAWCSPVNNPENNFKDKTGVDGYCIPICSDLDDEDHVYGEAPTKGILKLTIYVPALIPEDMKSMAATYYGLVQAASDDWFLGPFLNALFGKDINFSYQSVPWCIFCKDFELGVVYTDTQVWWNSHDKSNKDKVYVGYIDNTYKNELDDLECKLNTTIKDAPISRSFVTIEDTYLATMKHKAGDEEKVQEYNIVDMYLDHNSERKVIFQRNMQDYFKPYKKFSKSQFDSTLMIDTQSFDVRRNSNTIKFIEF